MNAAETTGTGRLHRAEHPAPGAEADISRASVVAAGLSATGGRPLIRDNEPPAGPDDDDTGVIGTCQSRDSRRCHWLQAFEDAIKFRHARAAAPCSDCDIASATCDDHARDLDLITEYQRTAHQLMQAAPDPLSSDTRITAAHDLLAEQHQPAALAAADLRGLLARYQRRLRGLLDVLAPGSVAGTYRPSEPAAKPDGDDRSEP